MTELDDTEPDRTGLDDDWRASALPALGVVLDEGRGALPFALLHGEALVACASWALGEAQVTSVDLGTPWWAVQETGDPLVLHDVLCPMTPAEFIAGCVTRAVEEDVVVVGVRPVTDTVKHVESGFVGETVDRSGLLAVVSPLVLPASVVAALPDWPGDDLATLVDLLAREHTVVPVEAPATARRVTSEEDVRVLEALTRPEGDGGDLLGELR